MKIPKGRPKTFAGKQIGVLLPGLVDLRIRGEAQRTGRTISEIVRESLIKTWGGDEGTRENFPG